ncbi:TIGR02281 family clan AA aspartic protease [Aquabacterium sp. A7-Y]|uniref:retropepsin-like aspartic protease family protein n=1 Tax=Aquabacterium sp. A7-Y TaxID=1349605 RepID=UPI00223D41F1|nr:TIGR02281 family clan AA aspartic protease [Aquabacterium sp. A7-Y]MCW7536414.1 TIGR02281 family clan AA aspartic protease [Aquabacterium sp. A7-Y]
MKLACKRGLAAALVLLCQAALAQSVALTGSLGSKALLMIDGKARTVAVGSSVDGVRLLSLTDGQARIEAGGRQQTLVLGGSPVRLGGTSSGARIVLSAGSGGHFHADGQINGRSVRFMVDTGATLISMAVSDAQRIGLKYQDGQRINLSTANGVVPGYLVSLDRVRVGDVEVFNVQGVVAQRDMPYILLGNSFLSRFQLKRENDQLTLDKRF